MNPLSISEISALTGFTRETIAKRLADIPFIVVGKAKKYDLKAALPLLYEQTTQSGQVDLMRERALLARSQRTKLDIEIGVMQRDLIPASVVEATWSGMTSAARQRLLAIPYRIAMAAQSADGNFARIESAATELVREALEELHSYDANDYAPGKRGMAVSAAAETHREPVG